MQVTATGAGDRPGSRWTFLSNHSHVIILLSRDPTARIRDIASQVGITERAAQKILTELESDGYISKTKHGRRNHYDINTQQRLRHPVEAGYSIGELISLFSDERTDVRA
jgi:predicted ArsR family transcriptional regulator